MHLVDWQKLTCVLASAALLPAAQPQDCPPSWDGTSGQVYHPSHDVSALAVFDDGNGPALYVGGGFGLQGNPSIQFIARWDGDEFSAVGGGVSNAVHDLVVFDDGSGSALYATGFFSSAEGRPVRLIAKWDGDRWSALGSGLGGSFATGNALAVFDDGRGPALYAGGSFEMAGGVPASNIARWDGSMWEPLATGLSARCYSLCAYDDGNGQRLYAGGIFSRAGGVTVNAIACWNGNTWASVDTGLTHPTDAVCQCMTVFDDGAGAALYVGGWFSSAGGVPASHIARWNGQTWSTFGTEADSGVHALAVWETGGRELLLASGAFSNIGGVAANSIATWDGASWHPLGQGVDYQGGCCRTITALAAYDADPHGPSLYAGGHFSHAGGLPAVSLARWGCPYLLGDVTCDGSVNIFDIDAFVLALTSPAGYAAAWPDCFLSRADANNDGSINQFDIQPFIEVLSP